MSQNRKMWISAGVVGAILVGGASVVAAASVAGAEKASQETTTVVTPQPQSPQRTPSPTPTDRVVTKDLNTEDPVGTGLRWTEERLEEAEPMPMPVVTFE
ncbi:hypothetical protein [Thermostaphylospora chromogena]|jgi:hypothetical protein|uniref:Uncharacterized protein n=1 Tax=Thermostaphylospora chromogena TaxID=35622 RepID=A0A1H1GZI2_9ACTN|nr:hypothetical protein [Thermostaphylospora chromogena]SDR18236.1 hypothetical protein SAMN04489764_3916 [Thermostaphylospora chromogena]